ncbi:MAG: glycoside-pentoside-hexuronide (GPH):cation symporter, partial [Planctomycetota bacterium]
PLPPRRTTLFPYTTLSIYAINDPIVGILADKTRTRWGRYRPWLLWSALPFAVMGVLAFSTPPLGETGKLVYAYVTYTILGMAYTAVSIPLTSMIGVASDKSIVRTSLSAWNMFGAFVASLFAQLFTLKLVETLGGVETGMSVEDEIAAKQVGFQFTTFIYSGVAIVALLYAFVVMRERVTGDDRSDVKAKADRKPDVPLLTQLRHLVTCRPWVILLGVFLTMCLFISIRGASQVFYMKYYLGISGDAIDFFGYTLSEGSIIGIYLALGSVGCLIGTPLMAPLAKRFGKRNVFLGMIAISAVIGGLHYPLGRDAILMALVLQVLVGLFSGPLFVLKNAMLADVAETIELRHGYRPTGLVYSAASFGLKFGWTIGGAVAGYALDFFDFVPNVEQSERAIGGIVLMMSWLPTVPMALAAVLLAFYPLTDKQVEENAEALSRRKNGQSASA